MRKWRSKTRRRMNIADTAIAAAWRRAQEVVRREEEKRKEVIEKCFQGSTEEMTSSNG